MFNDLDENKIREQYNKTIEEDLPDMNLIWADIESRLDSEENSEKPEITPTEVTHEPKKSKSPIFVIIRSAALFAACAAAVFGAAKFAFSPSMNTSYAATGSAADSAAAENSVYENAAEAAEEQKNATDAVTAEGAADGGASYPLYYENLPLAKSDGKEIVLSSIPESNGYFVEDEVLKKTDLFMYATVADVEVVADGTKAAYAFTDCVISDGTGFADTENITVESSSPFIMKPNRRYLLALSRNTDDTFSLAFEDAPQIEVTLDGGLVFHNGWQSLCENSEELIYPKDKNNEYFYDRIRYSASGNTDALFARWRTLRN